MNLKLTSKTADAEAYSNEISALRISVATLRKKVADKELEIDTAKTERDVAMKKVQLKMRAQSDHLDVVKEQLAVAQDKIQTLESADHTLHERLNASETRLAEALATLQTCKDNDRENGRRIGSLLREAEEAEENCKQRLHVL